MATEASYCLSSYLDASGDGQQQPPGLRVSLGELHQQRPPIQLRRPAGLLGSILLTRAMGKPEAGEKEARGL